MRELLNFVRPPEDADWKHVNRWRWNVCLTLLVLGVATAAASFGPTRFARADEVDRKIAPALQEKIDPIAKEQREQRVVLDRVSRLLTEQLAESVAAQIRLNISKRCKATTFEERDALVREKDRLQDQYRTYTGELYREPSCAEL
jgi:hypothetical protein